jgi:hypothetical protein
MEIEPGESEVRGKTGHVPRRGKSDSLRLIYHVKHTCFGFRHRFRTEGDEILYIEQF